MNRHRSFGIEGVAARPTASSLAATGAAVIGCAVAGTLASSPRTRWYRSLDKPPWNPPNAAFPIAWTSLYALIAVSTGGALADARAADRRDALRRVAQPDASGAPPEAHTPGGPGRTVTYAAALCVNLALNAGWSFVFFRAHRTGGSALWAAALALSSADLVRRTTALNKKAGIALAPYVAWTAFAAALSTEIWRRNR